MEVVIEHFLDAGEQDARGEWDYFYEGDLFTFSSKGTTTLKARIYADIASQASFIEQREQLEASPLTPEAVEYLHRRGVTEIHCLGPGGYGIWSAD